MSPHRVLLPRFELESFTAQGGRGKQEDRVFMHTFVDTQDVEIGHFLAILDGHGGAEAADAILDMLPYCMPTFVHALREGQLDPTRLLATLCATLYSGTVQFNAGTTFTCAFIDATRMHCSVAQLGDSILLLVRKGAVVAVTNPHNARMNPSDRERVIERGAFWDGSYLFHGPYGIQCTRTLGDRRIPEIIREPEISSHTIKRGDVIVLATDGVITTSNNECFKEEIQDIAELIAHNRKISAEDITYHGMEVRESHDNATTIILRIK